MLCLDRLKSRFKYLAETGPVLVFHLQYFNFQFFIRLLIHYYSLRLSQSEIVDSLLIFVISRSSHRSTPKERCETEAQISLDRGHLISLSCQICAPIDSRRRRGPEFLGNVNIGASGQGKHIVGSESSFRRVIFRSFAHSSRRFRD